MNDDMTFAQVQRLRQWIVQCYEEHRAYCPLCRNWIRCPDLDRLFTLYCRYTSRLVDMQQWELFDRESEGV